VILCGFKFSALSSCSTCLFAFPNSLGPPWTEPHVVHPSSETRVPKSRYLFWSIALYRTLPVISLDAFFHLVLAVTLWEPRLQLAANGLTGFLPLLMVGLRMSLFFFPVLSPVHTQIICYSDIPEAIGSWWCPILAARASLSHRVTTFKRS